MQTFGALSLLVALAVAKPFHRYEQTLAQRDTSACTGGTPIAIGYGRLAVPNTAKAFSTNTAFDRIAYAAVAPTGYNTGWVNVNASYVNTQSYMGYISLNSYNTTRCAIHCAKSSGCQSFNIYLERAPTVDPGSGQGCSNPVATTMIKCAIWSSAFTMKNVTNDGQMRADFQVLVAASNGYSRLPMQTEGNGFNDPIALPDAAIISPIDCNGANSYLGYEDVGTANMTFDQSLCLAACNRKTNYALAHPPKTGAPQLCKFYNTYLLMRNGTSTGQVCAMYSQSWAASYATNVGQYRGANKYTISQSWMSSNATDAGSCVVRRSPVVTRRKRAALFIR